MTVLLDEDVSHQITLTREGDVIIGVTAAPVLPFVDGRSPLINQRFQTDHTEI